MERREKVFDLACPSCKHEFKKDLPTAIFAKENDEDILDFARITCPSCGEDFLLNYRFAYTDEINEFMIVNDPAFVDRKARLAFSTSLNLIDKFRKDELYRHELRVTYDYETLLEKIKIFERGLNDKVVELMKYFLIMSEDFAYGPEQIADFRYGEDNKFYLKTVLNVSLSMDFSDVLYDTIINNYEEALKKDRTLLIDKAWAEDFLSKN